MVVFRDPGSVPENWRPLAEEENLEAGSSMQMSDNVVPEALASTWSSSDGLERKQTGYCSRCQNGKPPRCHHCSICKPTCLLMLLTGFYIACILACFVPFSFWAEIFYSPALADKSSVLHLFISRK